MYNVYICYISGRESIDYGRSGRGKAIVDDSIVSSVHAHIMQQPPLLKLKITLLYIAMPSLNQRNGKNYTKKKKQKQKVVNGIKKKL